MAAFADTGLWDAVSGGSSLGMQIAQIDQRRKDQEARAQRLLDELELRRQQNQAMQDYRSGMLDIGNQKLGLSADRLGLDRDRAEWTLQQKQAALEAQKQRHQDSLALREQLFGEKQRGIPFDAAMKMGLVSDPMRGTPNEPALGVLSERGVQEMPPQPIQNDPGEQTGGLAITSDLWEAIPKEHQTALLTSHLRSRAAQEAQTRKDQTIIKQIAAIMGSKLPPEMMDAAIAAKSGGLSQGAMMWLIRNDPRSIAQSASNFQRIYPRATNDAAVATAQERAKGNPVGLGDANFTGQTRAASLGSDREYAALQLEEKRAEMDFKNALASAGGYFDPEDQNLAVLKAKLDRAQSNVLGYLRSSQQAQQAVPNPASALPPQAQSIAQTAGSRFRIRFGRDPVPGNPEDRASFRQILKQLEQEGAGNGR